MWNYLHFNFAPILSSSACIWNCFLKCEHGLIIENTSAILQYPIYFQGFPYLSYTTLVYCWLLLSLMLMLKQCDVLQCILRAPKCSRIVILSYDACVEELFSSLVDSTEAWWGFFCLFFLINLLVFSTSCSSAPPHSMFKALLAGIF